MRLLRSSRGVLFSLLVMSVWLGCGGSDLPVDATPDQILSHVEKRLADGDYYDASELLEHFIRTHPGTALTPLAKLRLGDARFGMGEFVLAQGEYEDVVLDYPGSPHVEEARFRIAMCAYSMTFPYDRDQTETERAVRLLHDFQRDYPDSQFREEADSAMGDCRKRLARREYEAGRFYQKNRRLRSAKIQFEFVVQNYPETQWAPKSALGIGEIYRFREKWDQAAIWLQTVTERWPESPEAELARVAQETLPAGVVLR